MPYHECRTTNAVPRMPYHECRTANAVPRLPYQAVPRILRGLEKQNLSVIDILGIFRTLTEGMIIKSDIILVRNIIYYYIRDKRIIILAVIPSNTNIIIQEILIITKEIDPNNFRILGVLTKPDLIDNSNKESIISLVKGKQNLFCLRYYIIRNKN
jgi:Dynamin family